MSELSERLHSFFGVFWCVFFLGQTVKFQGHLISCCKKFFLDNISDAFLPLVMKLYTKSLNDLRVVPIVSRSKG